MSLELFSEHLAYKYKSCTNEWVQVFQLYLTLCDPMDYRVHGILQARTLEWVVFLFSRDIPNAEIEPRSPALQEDFLSAEPQGKPPKKRKKGDRQKSIGIKIGRQL